MPQLNAKQLSFTKQENGDDYSFDYQWLDYKRTKNHLAFSLSKDLLFNKFRTFKSYQPEIADITIKKNILKIWRNTPLPNSQLRLIKKQNIYELKLSTSNDEDLKLAQEKLAEIERQAKKDYFEKSYYHEFYNADDLLAIKPNHTQIAYSSVDDLKFIKPIILAEVDIKNIRNATNYVLGFSQAIPYAKLESRVTSSGAGFSPPATLLWENQGDCDSKVTLTAALLRSLMPRVKIALVFIDGHALIGIETGIKGDDMSITIDKVDYILGEPTGPATLPLGTISDESAQAILNGMYIVELLE